jgi:hypothetical protein
VSVVDHADLTTAVEVLESVGEEHLAIETSEGGIELEEQHTGITQDQRGGLHQAQLASDLDSMRRGVVLHLLARGEVIFSDRQFAFLADSLATAKSGQCGVGKLRSCRDKFFMHAYQIALTTLVKLQDLLPVGRGFFWAL